MDQSKQIPGRKCLVFFHPLQWLEHLWCLPRLFPWS